MANFNPPRTDASLFRYRPNDSADWQVFYPTKWDAEHTDYKDSVLDGFIEDGSFVTGIQHKSKVGSTVENWKHKTLD